MSYKDLERALRYSEARFLALFDDLPTMAVMLDTEGKMVMVNQACVTQLGYAMEELVGHSVLNLFHPADRAAVLEKLRYCLNNRDEVQYWQFRKVTRDGALLWVEEVVQPVHDLEGQTNVLVVCQDVSEQKRLKTEIEEAKRYAEVIVETLIEPLVVLNSDFIILSANHSFYDTFKLPREQTIGTPIYDLAGRNWDHPALRVLLEQILPEKGVCNGYELEHDFQNIGLRTILINARRIARENSGRPLILLAMEDITERKRTEEVLRETARVKSEFLEKLNQAQQVAKIGSWEWDLETGSLWCSEETCTILGSPKRLESFEDYREFIHPDDALSFQESVQQALSGQGRLDVDVKVVVESGLQKRCNFKGKLCLDESGRPSRFIGTIMDVTERKRAEEEIKRLNDELTERAAQLEAANKEQEAFNHTVAHDLRQPLDLLSSYCQMIDRLCGKQVPEECLRYLHDAYNVTLQMNKLIRALLEFSHMSRIDLHRNSVDLSLMAQEVCLSLKAAEPQRDVEFRIEEGIVAECDSNLMRIVLNNLIGNSWKFTAIKEKAVIWFGVETIDGTAAFFVRDNGLGFGMADAEKLFAPFQRLPGVEQSTKGFGIGLATVERIIRRHGGRVWAEGEPGKGACIRFTLPAPESPTEA